LLNSKVKIKCDLGIFPHISASHVFKISGELRSSGGISSGNMPRMNPGNGSILEGVVKLGSK